MIRGFWVITKKKILKFVKKILKFVKKNKKFKIFKIPKKIKKKKKIQTLKKKKKLDILHKHRIYDFQAKRPQFRFFPGVDCIDLIAQLENLDFRLLAIAFDFLVFI